MCGPKKEKENQQLFLKLCKKNPHFITENWNILSYYFAFIFKIPLISPLKAQLIFFENKDMISFTIMYLSQVQRTGKPNKKASKTALHKRQSFINKDVLSVKIITVAKPNMAQDPEKSARRHSEETVQHKGTKMTPQGPFHPNVPLYLSQSTFLHYDLLLCVPRRSSPEGSFQQSDNKG